MKGERIQKENPRKKEETVRNYAWKDIFYVEL